MKRKNRRKKNPEIMVNREQQGSRTNVQQHCFVGNAAGAYAAPARSYRQTREANARERQRRLVQRSAFVRQFATEPLRKGCGSGVCSGSSVRGQRRPSVHTWRSGRYECNLRLCNSAKGIPTLYKNRPQV